MDKRLIKQNECTRTHANVFSRLQDISKSFYALFFLDPYKGFTLEFVDDFEPVNLHKNSRIFLELIHFQMTWNLTCAFKSELYI